MLNILISFSLWTAFHVAQNQAQASYTKVGQSDRVTLTTPQGNIVIRLRVDVAPKSSAMFERLVSDGLYNGCTFYRAEDFCIQGGLRTADGKVRSNPLGKFPFEYGLQNKRGTVTLARWQDPNSATGEFFINVKDSPHLDRTGTTGWSLGFAVFGEVESGMDVVDRIASLPTHPQGGLSMLATPVSFQAQLSESVEPSIAKPSLPSFAAEHFRVGVDIAQVGRVPIKLFTHNAPYLVQVIKSLAQRGIGGSLHRAEDIPTPPSQGPPYALVQITLDDPDGSLRQMKHEGSITIERGSVCMIPGSSDFFISLGQHAGWESSMTVFGQVESTALDKIVMPILQRPHHSFKHPTFGTVMSMLDTALPLHLSLVSDDSEVLHTRDSEQNLIDSAEVSDDMIFKETGAMLRGTIGYKDL